MGEQRAIAVGCIPQMLPPVQRPHGYIYLGGFQAHDSVLYLKAGKTGCLDTRQKAYAGMVPGGLTFMYAVEVGSPGDQCKAEKALMQALAAIDGIEPVGGEWFKCSPLLRFASIDELYRVGTAGRQVRVYSPTPFGEKRLRNNRRRRV